MRVVKTATILADQKLRFINQTHLIAEGKLARADNRQSRLHLLERRNHLVEVCGLTLAGFRIGETVTIDQNNARDLTDRSRIVSKDLSLQLNKDICRLGMESFGAIRQKGDQRRLKPDSCCLWIKKRDWTRESQRPC